MDIPYKTINILLEATEKCNLRCKYCYHADEGYDSPNMSEAIFKKVCDMTFPHYEQIQFLWHGGEPFCTGLAFHEKIHRIQREYEIKYPNVKVVNAIQTNATLIDSSIAHFLAENNFTVGVSFDGIENHKTRGKTKEVLCGINNLRNAGVKFLGAITVLSGLNIEHIIKDYEYMKTLNLSTDYNSLVLTGGACHNKDVQLNYNTYCAQMKKFFNTWFYDRDCGIVVNPFHSYVRDIIYGTASVCWRTSCLGRWINIKPDGSVFPCSREYPEEYSFGTIQDCGSIRELFDSEAFERLVAESVERREKCANDCKWYDYCQGGCSCTALTESGITNNGGFSCNSFKEIFEYCFNEVSRVRNQGKDYIDREINPMIGDMLKEGL